MSKLPGQHEEEPLCQDEPEGTEAHQRICRPTREAADKRRRRGHEHDHSDDAGHRIVLVDEPTKVVGKALPPVRLVDESQRAVVGEPGGDVEQHPEWRREQRGLDPRSAALTRPGVGEQERRHEQRRGASGAHAQGQQQPGGDMTRAEVSQSAPDEEGKGIDEVDGRGPGDQRRRASEEGEGHQVAVGAPERTDQTRAPDDRGHERQHGGEVDGEMTAEGIEDGHDRLEHRHSRRAGRLVAAFADPLAGLEHRGDIEVRAVTEPEDREGGGQHDQDEGGLAPS